MNCGVGFGVVVGAYGGEAEFVGERRRRREGRRGLVIGGVFDGSRQRSMPPVVHAATAAAAAGKEQEAHDAGATWSSLYLRFTHAA